jgi:Fe-S cluster biosynthesis and repair protein YggX
MYFCKSVYFKTSEKKTPTDPDKISEEIFPNLSKQAVGKFALNFRFMG